MTAELPLVIFDIQRGGPSTGLPTKTEQADLMQALYGRNSESPVVVIAPVHARATASTSPTRRCGIAIKYMVPVMVLSDGYLANGSEPWLIPDVKTLPDIPVGFRTEKEGFFPVPARSRPRWRGRGCARARRGSSTASAASRSRT